MRSALGMMIFLVVLIAGAWVMKFVKNARSGRMTNTQKICNIIGTVFWSALLVMLMIPLLRGK